MSAADLPALPELKRVTAADVHKAGTHVATLTRSPAGEVTFAYLPGHRGDAVASTLPVGVDPVTRPGGGLPPFFAGLLPEGHRLTVLRRASKTSADDELTLLLATGGDLPGDVQVAPAGVAPEDPQPLASDDPAGLDFAALMNSLDRHGRAGLLVTRFDRERQADGSFRRLALEDAAQALDIYPAQKYAVTTEEVILALAGSTAARTDGGRWPPSTTCRAPSSTGT